jgi:hypothetical protein
MSEETLPDTKILTFFSEGSKKGQKTKPVPFSKAELLTFPEVKEWLAKGYELDSFENKLSPKDPSHVIVAKRRAACLRGVARLLALELCLQQCNTVGRAGICGGASGQGSLGVVDYVFVRGFQRIHGL